jgi:RimJ/RimL family protein N-acetyltransferase
MLITLSHENIILENELVHLVPLNISHTTAFIQYALEEPETWKYSLVSPGGSAAAMEKYIGFALQERDENKAYPYTVIHKPDNSIAGCSRFYDIDFDNKVASIGYTWYGEKFRRTGLNRQCKLLLLTHAFETWQLERVEFRADHNNAASIAAMKAIGCVEEGILRSHAAIPGGRRTSIVLSILKEEWENGVKEGLQKKIY